MTRSRSSSRDASRRSEARGAARAALAAGFALLLSAAPLRAAPTLAVSAAERGGALVASLQFRWDQPQELIASLLGGLESRIVFTVRLYEKRTGLFAFRGDRVLSQLTIVRTAHRDILTQTYVVEEEGQPSGSFATIDALLAAFFAVPGVSFPPPGAGRGGAYVAARAQLEPVRLMPPLTLVTLAGAGAYATPWVRSAAP